MTTRTIRIRVSAAAYAELTTRAREQGQSRVAVLDHLLLDCVTIALPKPQTWSGPSDCRSASQSATLSPTLSGDLHKLSDDSRKT